MGLKCPAWSSLSHSRPPDAGQLRRLSQIGGASHPVPDLGSAPLPSPCPFTPLWLHRHWSLWGQANSHVTLLLKNRQWLPIICQMTKSLRQPSRSPNPTPSPGGPAISPQLSSQPHKGFSFHWVFPLCLREQCLCGSTLLFPRPS